jgi:hypothetical protein
MWAKVNAGGNAASTVPSLVDDILSRAPDKADALKRVVRAGYSPADRRSYTSSFTLLDEPQWFNASVVPRVRTADAGVSRLRYQVILDEQLCADEETTVRLWEHFHGHQYEPRT